MTALFNYRLCRMAKNTAWSLGCVLLITGGCNTPSAGDSDANVGNNLRGTSTEAVDPVDNTPLLTRPSREFDAPKLPAQMAEEENPREASARPKPVIPDATDRGETMPVTLTLESATMADVVSLFAELLQLNYVIESESKNTVSVQIDGELSEQQLRRLLNQLLAATGAYAVEEDGYLRVRSMQNLPREPRLKTVAPGKTIAVELLGLENAVSTETVPLLVPFLTEGGSCTDVARLNSLLVVDAADNLGKIKELLRELDVPGESRWPHVCIPVQHVGAKTAVEELNELLPVLGFPVSESSPSGGKVKLTALSRLQLVVASAALPQVLDEIEYWLDVIDRKELSDREHIFFYSAEHNTAAELSEILEVFFDNTRVHVRRIGGRLHRPVAVRLRQAGRTRRRICRYSTRP
jgi:general secretion pathway protein D